MQDIFSALPALLDQHNDNDDVRRSVVFAIWKRVAGESLLGHAVPIDLKENRLTVAVADRNWQRNLMEISGEMIFRMNQVFGDTQVKLIEFVIDKETLTSSKPTIPDRAKFESAALGHISEPLRKAADTIQNDDLRRKFLLAAGSCLARVERLAEK